MIKKGRCVRGGGSYAFAALEVQAMTNRLIRQLRALQKGPKEAMERSEGNHCSGGGTEGGGGELMTQDDPTGGTFSRLGGNVRRTAAVSRSAEAGDPSPRGRALTIWVGRQKPHLYSTKVGIWRLAEQGHLAKKKAQHCLSTGCPLISISSEPLVLNDLCKCVNN